MKDCKNVNQKILTFTKIRKSGRNRLDLKRRHFRTRFCMADSNVTSQRFRCVDQLIFNPAQSTTN